MLSFDITDKQLKVVKGIQTGAKVKVSETTIIDVPEGMISDGFVQDIPSLASIINSSLKEKHMLDKDAVISISSSLIVFKELDVPKAKGSQLLTMVKNQMQYNMGISSDYSFSYTIVGEGTEDKSNTYRILASACPREVVNNLKKLFSMLSIQLKSVSVSCNCITRIILSNNKNKDKMPLLVFEVNDNFLNINLYEKNQLAFSRFVSINKEDYESDDYVLEALNENVFRMIQFNKSRGGEQIRDIVFYGNVSNYISMTRAIEQQDVNTHILAVPNSVLGYERIEFTTFANAIGAMFKRKKETEHINLLNVESSSSGKSIKEVNSGFMKSFALSFVGSAVILAGAFLVLEMQNKNIQDDVNTLEAYVNDTKITDQIDEINEKAILLGKMNTYKADAEIAETILKGYPIWDSKVFENVKDVLEEGTIITGCDISDESQAIFLNTHDISFPARCVEELEKKDCFENITYTGFESDQGYNFALNIVLKDGEE